VSILDNKLQEIQVLREKAKRIENLDEYLEERITQYKRNIMIQEVKDSIKLVLENMPINQSWTKEEELLVHSSFRFNARERGGEEYISAILNPIQQLLDLPNQKFYRKYDSKNNRIIFLDEFKKRSNILLEKIEKGALDDVYYTKPFTLLHMINGRHGELLKRLGIDPEESRIYKGLKR
jgi:hypothetical protein